MGLAFVVLKSMELEHRVGESLGPILGPNLYICPGGYDVGRGMMRLLVKRPLRGPGRWRIKHRVRKMDIKTLI